MSKNNSAGNEQQEEEEFVALEVDDSGKPLNPVVDSSEGAEDQDDNDDQDGDGSEEDEDSDEQRLGHAEGDQEEETPEERRDRRRREQKAKRVRNRVAAEAKDRLIQNQGQMLLNLQEQVAKLQGRTIQYDANLLQSQLSQVEAQQADAKAVLAKLIKANDGEGVAEMTELQMQLRDQHRVLVEQLRRAKDPKRDSQSGDSNPNPQARRAPAPDPEVVRLAQDWAAKNKWANPRTGDPEEIAIIKAVDQHLHGQGWDPRSPDYWEELTERVRKRLPHHFKKAAPNGGGNRGERRVSGDNGSNRPAQGGPKMAPASQSSGGSRPLGKNEVRVTPARKAAMQTAGKWDDPVKRKRMLAEYAKYDRENAGQ